MFTGQESSSGSNFFKIVKGIILKVSIKNSNLLWSEGSSDLSFSISCTFLPACGQQTLKWFFLLQIFPLTGHLTQGCELSENLHYFIKSLKLWLQVLQLDLFSFFLKTLSILTTGWHLGNLWACLQVSSTTWLALVALHRRNLWWSYIW